MKIIKKSTKSIAGIYKKSNDMEDYLTSLYNKNYFIKNMHVFYSKMIAGIMENKKNKNKLKTWSILFCDIDGLKLANDTIGHIAADKGIAHIASIVKHSIRTNRDEQDNIIYPDEENKLENIPIRFGGDEFVILLPNCTKEHASLIAKRIRKQIEDEKDKTFNMALSIGIADTSEVKLPKGINNTNAPQEFFDKLLSIAEKEMYIDKHKDIDSLSYEKRKLVIMKNINRVAHQLGFDASDPTQLEALINILIETKEEIEQNKKK